MKHWWLVIIALIVYCASVWTRPPFLPDETRYSLIAYEMATSGDWIKPTLAGFDYYEKPIMGHWLNAVAIKLFGFCAGSSRIMPAICTLLTALMIFLLVRRAQQRSTGIDNDDELPWFCAAIYLTSGFVFAVGTYGVLDAILTFFVITTLACYFYAYTEACRRKRLLFLALCGASAGCAFLTKGFVGFVLPGLAVIGFLFWEKAWKKIAFDWIIPLIVALLTIAPWGIAIYRRDPDFWHYFIVVEHIQRALEPTGAHHPQPFWFFAALYPLVLLPGIIMIGGVIIGFRQKCSELLKSPIIRLSLMAFILPFLFLSFSEGKLLTYVLPCTAGVAIIFGYAINQYLASGHEKAWNIPLKTLTWLLAIVAAVLFIAQALALFWRQYPQKFTLYDLNDRSWMIMILTLAAVAVAWNLSIREKVKNNKIYLFFAGTAILMSSIHICMPTRFLGNTSLTPYIEKFALPRLSADTILVTDQKLLSSACFVLKRTDIPFAGYPGELKYGFDKVAPATDRHYDVASFKALVDSGVKVVLLVSEIDEFADYPKPEVKTEFKNVRFIIMEYNVGADTKFNFEFKGL